MLSTPRCSERVNGCRHDAAGRRGEGSEDQGAEDVGGEDDGPQVECLPEVLLFGEDQGYG